MSSTDHDRIAYRRLLNSFARELSADEVEQIAFIYCKENAANYNTKESALSLLRKLEHLAIFSFEDPRGLIQVAKDVQHLKWEKEVEDFLESRRRVSLASAKPAVKKRSTLIPNEVRQHLEEVHDEIVTKCSAFEEEFEEAWKGETVSKADGLKLLRKGEEIVEDMQTALKKGAKKLSRPPRPTSGSSSDSNSGSEYYTTSPVDNATRYTPRSGTNRDKPMPKPRKPQPPPPYKAVEQESTPYNSAVQESTRHDTPLLRLPLSTMNVDQQTHDPPPPIPPKKNSPRLSAKHQHSGVSKMCYTRSPVFMRSQKKYDEHVATEEEDQTGDSGMGTGSGIS
jgi:hypothetical protein